MKHTISILVENEFGALARIAGLFSSRGYNIESLTVAPTQDSQLSRMTVNTVGDDGVVEQILKQLNKLVSVVKVKDVTSEETVSRSLGLIKLNLGARHRPKIQRILRDYEARIVWSDEKCSLIQAVAEDCVLGQIRERLDPYGVMEFVSTGEVAIQKGKRVMK